MTAQLDAVGQVVGGPPLGALVARTTTSTALLASALVLSPAMVLYARPAGDHPIPDGSEQHHHHDEAGPSGPAGEANAPTVGLPYDDHRRD